MAKKNALAQAKAEEAEVMLWDDRIKRGQALRKKKMKKVKKAVKYYKGLQHEAQFESSGNKPVTNLIFAYIKTQLPSLYFQNPKWYVRPKPGNRDKVDYSEIAQNYLNYYTNENMRITLKKQMRLAILDAFFTFGAIKTGYVADIELTPRQGEDHVIGYSDGKEIYDSTVKANNQSTFDISEDGELKDYVGEEESSVTNEKFVARRISPASLIFDVECENYFEDGRFIIHEISKPLADIKNDPKYENTSDLKESYTIKPSKGLSDADLQKEEYASVAEDLKRVTIYEIYDMEHKKLKVVAEGHKRFLRNDPMPAGIDGSPISFLQFNDIPDELYPLSDIEVLMSPQDEYNKGREIIMTHAKRFNRKYGYIDGMIDETEMRVVENGSDGSFFKVKDLPLAKVMEPLTDAPLDISVYQNFDQARMGFDKVAGSTEADRGVVERRKSATEAGLMGQSAGVRKEDRRSLVEDFASQVGEKILQSMQANLSIEDAMQIDRNGVKEWMTVSRENIKGQYSVGVIVDSATPKLPQYERQDFLLFMQVVAQFPPEITRVKLNLDGLLAAVPKMFPSLEDIQLLNDDNTQKMIQQELDKERRFKKFTEIGKIKNNSIIAGQQPRTVKRKAEE